VGKLKGIQSLDLSDNQIQDLTPLGLLQEVKILQLQRNRITDLAPLLKAAQKDVEGPKYFAPYLRLYLVGNPLSADARMQQIPALTKLGVRVTTSDKDAQK
jgi:Leucine-rich repeat (LRR) protein